MHSLFKLLKLTVFLVVIFTTNIHANDTQVDNNTSRNDFLGVDYCYSNLLQVNEFDDSTKYSLVQIQNYQPNDIVPSKQIVYTTKKLEDLYLKKGYQQGNGLIVKYTITVYEEGNRALRYAVGALSQGPGEGKLTIETSFYDTANKKLIGKVETKSAISRGVFGGDFQNVLDKVILEIYKFSKNNYLN